MSQETKIVTTEMFKEATGYEPWDDDLERCNCPNAGEIGHTDCGWNEAKNRPNFFSDDPDET